MGNATVNQEKGRKLKAGRRLAACAAGAFAASRKDLAAPQAL